MFHLAFTPITWSHELSHGNLSGDDFTDCLFKFFHIVCTIAIGQNYQKALIFAPSRAVNKAGGGFFNSP